MTFSTDITAPGISGPTTKSKAKSATPESRSITTRHGVQSNRSSKTPKKTVLLFEENVKSRRDRQSETAESAEEADLISSEEDLDTEPQLSLSRFGFLWSTVNSCLSEETKLFYGMLELLVAHSNNTVARSKPKHTEKEIVGATASELYQKNHPTPHDEPQVLRVLGFFHSYI